MSPFTAITHQRFANKAWKHYINYAFAAEANVIPAIAAELANLVPILPLGFVQNNTSFQLVVITSLQPGTNLFVAPNGDWIGSYIPAALRGYPFRAMSTIGNDQSILCIDESSGLVVDAGQGEAFFDEAGQPTKEITDMLDFITQVEASRAVTQTAVDALQAADLIQNWRVNMQNGDRTVAVEGLYRIDETKLNALSDDAFLSLRTAGGLPLAYAQLLSMNQLSILQIASDMQARFHANNTPPQNLDGLKGFSFADNETLKFS